MKTEMNTIFAVDAAVSERLRALESCAGNITPADTDGIEYVNCHIHTTYSFSPYTPTAAVWKAKEAGLATAGIMDHDSIGGAEEFIRAGKILDMPVTVGFECRVSCVDTPLEGRRINNPDQTSCAYVAMHGIPHNKFAEAEAALRPLRIARDFRNEKMCANISALTEKIGISIDYKNDVLPISNHRLGGGVTERHVLFALTKKLTENRKREDAISLVEELCGDISSKKDMLASAPTEYFQYDVLGILKSSMISEIYVPADDELMTMDQFCALADSLGAVSAYAYLGDIVGSSVTGDKKSQTFEDSYIDVLFDTLKEKGFRAVTYMPSRNTAEQLDRVMQMCDHYGFFQISGEDINSPRQKFICSALADNKFDHLRRNAFALIGHERISEINSAKGMFSTAIVSRTTSIDERAAEFEKIGRAQN